MNTKIHKQYWAHPLTPLLLIGSLAMLPLLTEAAKPVSSIEPFSIEVGTTDKPIPPISDDPHWSYEDDMAALQRWLLRLYPEMDKFSKRLPYGISYQWIAQNITWVVDYGPPTPRGGASAEDDPNFYAYPNAQLYHKEKTPQGKIRITATRLKIRQLQLIEAIEGEFGTREWGAFHRELGFFAHELTHAAQFMSRPIRNFFNHQDMVENGVVLAPLMRDIFDKANLYEPEGFYLAVLHEVGWAQEVAAYNARVDLYRQRHPEEFASHGKFALLAKYKMGLSDSYVELDFSQGSVRAKQWVDPSFYWLMNGLFEPPQIVRRMIQLAQSACVRGYDGHMDPELFMMQHRWNALFGTEESVAYLKIRHPYLFDRGIVSKYDELLLFWPEIRAGHRGRCPELVAIDLLK